MEEFTKLIIKWHHDRNLIDGSTDKDQVLKLAQELGPNKNIVTILCDHGKRYASKIFNNLVER